MPDARVNDRLGGADRRAPIVRWKHVDPNDTHADVCVGMVLQNRLLCRTGTLQARWSRRRHNDEQPQLVLVAAKAGLQRSE
jgi:hypothetical protein